MVRRASGTQSKQSAKIFLQSSEFGLPQPLTRRRVPPPPGSGGGGEGNTRWRERGWESPNSNEGTYTVVLFVYMYFVILNIQLTAQQVAKEKACMFAKK
jgi:hypothetical protein